MEIHCDIPQDHAIRAQKKNNQLGGLSSKPRKGLKNRDPNKLVSNESSGVVKPSQPAPVIINLDTKKQKPKVLGEKKNQIKQSSKTSSKTKSALKTAIFSDFEIEYPAGRLGHEEEAFLSNQRNNALPIDFPFPNTLSRSKSSDTLKLTETVDEMGSLKQGGLIDEEEIDEILQNFDLNIHKDFSGDDFDYPICETEFDLNFH